MIAFTLEQLNGWIGQFIWPFVRILALVATARVLESAVPVKVKVGLSFVLAAAIGPTLDPMPPVAPGLRRTLDGDAAGADRHRAGLHHAHRVRLGADGR